jgi:hypothetical protein
VAALTVTSPGQTARTIVEKPGEVVDLQCTETLTDGTTRDATRIVTWASSKTSVATISSTGSSHAIAAGTTVVTATLPKSVSKAVAFNGKASAIVDVIGKRRASPRSALRHEQRGVFDRAELLCERAYGADVLYDPAHAGF